ncbi:MAG: uncharacterized protein H6Q42_2723 [Deltaproteobacteria bacterium]|nr:uncharacterized protein [Deltaproteobacteria bacterium]
MENWSFSDRVLLQIIPRIYAWVLRLLALTIRRDVLHQEHAEKFWNQEKFVIAAFWHQRLLMMPFLPHKGRVGMMISRHRDGEFIARAVKLFGIDSVRGSTTRGGAAALRGMVRFFESGAHLAITPDGPQGPRHVVQRGVIELARLTAAPIIPVAYSASRKKIFNSWDHFILPLPFCKVIYVYGEAIFIPRNLSEKELEEKRLLVEDRLRQVTAEADGYFQKASVS